jgi:hypothetical protein
MKSGSDVKLVCIPVFDTGNKDFPQTRSFPRSEGICATIPIVEAADDCYRFGVRRPDTKPRAAFPFVLSRVTAQMIIKTDVAALVEQVEVSIAEQ